MPPLRTGPTVTVGDSKQVEEIQRQVRVGVWRCFCFIHRVCLSFVQWFALSDANCCDRLFREGGETEEGTVERKGQDEWRGDDYGIDESPTTTTTITTNGPAFSVLYPVPFFFHFIHPPLLPLHHSPLLGIDGISPSSRHVFLWHLPLITTRHEAASSQFVHHIYIPDIPHLSRLRADFSQPLLAPLAR